MASPRAALAGPDDRCFAVADAGPNSGADHLTSIVPSTGVLTSVGDTGGSGAIETIAMGLGGNTLYAVDADQFGVIDQTTGVFSAIGTGLGAGINDVDSLTFDPFTGEVWGVDRNDGSQDVLFRIDETTGLAVPGTSVTIASQAVTGLRDIDDLAISSYDNTMYAVNNNSGGNDRLVSVDRSTGAVTVVLDLEGLGLTDLEGLAFDNSGRLFGTDGRPAPNGDFWELDIAGASVTSVAGLTPGGDYESLACLTADLNTVTGTVFADVNGDAALDAGDSGEGSVTVRLYRDANNNGVVDAGDALVDTTDTASDGTYSFSFASSGDFVLDIDTGDLPPGHTLSTDNVEVANFAGFGLTDPDNDFGYSLPGTIGDFVWEDIDQDGVQDGGEPGIQNVTVNLLDGSNNQVATTTTANDGSYSFTGLASGQYRIEVVAPTGFTISPTGQGGDGSLDSDVSPADGRSAIVDLAPGQSNQDLDAGLSADAPLPASLGDVVFEDADGDGVRDAGESGVAGVTVNLLDGSNNQVGTTTTAGDGSYGFTGLAPGFYRVEFVLPGGFSFSPADQGGDDSLDSDADIGTGRSPLVTLNSGENNPTIDAGVVPDAPPALASLGDVVFEDADGDGVRDAGESGVAGVTVNLLDGSNNQVGTTTTAGDGSYGFTGLAPGDYRVEFVLPGGFSFSPADQGGDDTVDSDANPADGRTGVVTLTAGMNNPTIDAGIYQDPTGPASASIGDTVYFDADGDGTQDPGEPGLPGLRVELRNSGGIVVAAATTGADGRYRFDDLAPGDYVVDVVVSNGLELTTANSQSHSPAAGESIDTADFGLVGTGSIGQLIWTDTDGDGDRDPGEPGVPDAEINLTWDGPDGQFGTPDDLTFATTTDSDGRYRFTRLPTGDYRIVVTGTTLPPDTRVTSSPDGDTNLETVVTLTTGRNIDDANFSITSSSGGQTEPPLAFTGANPLRAVTLAILLLGLGSAMLSLSGRGRRRSRS